MLQRFESRSYGIRTRAATSALRGSGAVMVTGSIAAGLWHEYDSVIILFFFMLFLRVDDASPLCQGCNHYYNTVLLYSYFLCLLLKIGQTRGSAGSLLRPVKHRRKEDSR